MDEFVKSLLKANYLITPSAYYLLREYYEKGEFSIVELVKFARSRESYIITDALATEFLKVKGLEVTT